MLATSTGAAVSVAQSGYVTSTGDAGIVLSSTGGNVTLTGSGAISAKGDALDLTTSGPGATASATHTGAIASTNGYGIYAETSQSHVTIAETGNVSGKEGIYANSKGDGVVDVTVTGTTTATGGDAIYAHSIAGVVNVTAGGLVSAVGGDGIDARTTGPGSSIAIDSTGVAATGKGISAFSSSGSIWVTNQGDINAGHTALDLGTTGLWKNINLWQTGSVTSDTGYGVHATTIQGAVNLNIWGDVVAGNTGIYATNDGGGVDPEDPTIMPADIYVNAHGNVTSTDGYGIYAYSPNGKVVVNADYGVISHATDPTISAVFAENYGSDAPVTVTTGGTVSSDNGIGIFAASTSSNVTVYANGDVSGTTAIYLSGEGGNLDAETKGNVVGSGDSTIQFDGKVFNGQGGTARLNNSGTISNTAGINGTIVTTSKVETSIENSGTMTGNLALSSYTNEVENDKTGLFNMGNSIDLGNEGYVFDNFGTVSVGGINNVATTTLNGSFISEADPDRGTGLMIEDLDLANGTGDKLNVSGQANLNGTLKLNLTSFSGDPQTIAFLTADQWINTRNIDTTANPTILSHVSYSNDNKTAYVTIDGFDFAPNGLSGDAATIGTYINSAVVGNPSLDPLGLGLANLSTIDEVNAALIELSPTIYTANQQNAQVDTSGFVNRLFSCKVADGADPFNAEGECNWARADYGVASHTGDADGSGYDAHAFNISGGRQVALGGDWRLDVGAGLVSSDTTTDNGASSKGATGQLGAALKFVPGQALLAASVTGTFGLFDNTRPLDFGGFTDTLKGNSQIATLDARLRAAYTFQAGDYYARPQVDLDAAFTHAGAVDETGTSAAMHIDAVDQVALSVSPALELGGQTVMDDDSIFRPFIRGGATVFADPTSTTTGRFTTDTSGNSFSVSSSSDQVVWNVSTGVDLLRGNGQTIRAYYDASFGATTTAQSAGLKLSAGY